MFHHSLWIFYETTSFFQRDERQESLNSQKSIICVFEKNLNFQFFFSKKILFLSLLLFLLLFQARKFTKHFMESLSEFWYEIYKFGWHKFERQLLKIEVRRTNCKLKFGKIQIIGLAFLLFFDE